MRLTDKNDPAFGKQVYLRWTGKRNGERFETAGSGPWGVIVEGDKVVLDHADFLELERDRCGMELRKVSGLVLQVSEITDGKLGEWKTVTSAKRGVDAGLEIKGAVWRIAEIAKGASYYTHRVEAQASETEIASALSQQFGVFESCEAARDGGLLTAVNFRLPA